MWDDVRHDSVSLKITLATDTAVSNAVQEEWLEWKKGSWGGPFICTSFSALWKLFLSCFLLKNLPFLASRTPSAAGWPRITKSLTANPKKQSFMSLFLWSFSSESGSALLINTEKKREREGTIREIKLDFQISHPFWKEVGDVSICHAWKKTGEGGWREDNLIALSKRLQSNYCQHFNKLCSTCVYLCCYQEAVLILYWSMFLYLGSQCVVVSQYLAVLFIFISFSKVKFLWRGSSKTVVM